MSRHVESLRLLADDTRLRIMHLLTIEPLTVAELQEILDLSQSSVSGHLSKLRRGGFIHALPEGSAHRYRLRDDRGEDQGACWNLVQGLTTGDPLHQQDGKRLAGLRTRRSRNWVDRVAGSLHREYVPGRTPESLMHGFITLADLGRCLDIGAGDGALIELLAPRAESLVCLEPNDAMVAAGQERVGASSLTNVRYKQAMAEELPFPDGTFDTVLSLQSLQYVSGPQQALTEAIRVLAPGGRLLVLTLAAHHHAEAERYGHLHRGFRRQQLLDWCTGLTDGTCYELPSESRPPRFTALLCTGRR